MAKLKNFLIVSYCGFAVLMEIAIIIPTLLPYIQSVVDRQDQATFIYSLTLSCFAGVQVMSSLSVGYVSRIIGMKPVYIIICILWFIGELLYASAEWPLNSPWAIFFGRLAAATGTGLYSVGLSYLSLTITNDAERSKSIATYRALTIFSTIPSSLLAILFSIPALAFNIGDYDVNAFTYPPLFNLCLIVSCFILMLFLDNVKDIKKPEVTPTGNDKTKSIKSKKVIYLSKATILGFIILLINGIIASSLTYAVPIVLMDAYGWPVIAYAVVFFFVALVNTTGAFLVRFVAKCMGIRRYLIIVPCLGFVCIMCAISAVGAAGANSLPQAVGSSLFVLATFGCYGGYQLEHTLMSTLFSSITPREFIVRMMPYTAVIYSLGKFIGPLLCEFEESIAGLGLIYYGLLVIFAIVMFLTIGFGKYFYIEDLSRTEVLDEETIIIQTKGELDNDNESETI